MTKYWTPPTFFTQNFFYKNDSEWPEMDFKHNFKKCNILLAVQLFFNSHKCSVMFLFSISKYNLCA